jgi:rhodanese-related sulfurtransferase
MMRAIALLTLHAVVAQAQVQHARDLENSTLGMPGHLAIPRRPSPSVPSAAGAARSHQLAQRTAHVVARAEGTDNNPLSVRPKIENVGKAEDLAKEGKASDKIGFRFDPAMSKWVRDDKSGDKVANWADKGGAIERPLTGSAYTVWPVVYLSLLDRGLTAVTGDEALKMVKDKGAVFVDVELEKLYLEGTVEGAVSVPMYQPVSGDSMMDNIKRIALGAMAMQATERNPDFKKVAQERLPKGKPLIVACNRGGSMATTVLKKKNGYTKEYADPDRSFGIESRSLKACYELYEAGFTNIYVLKGGINQWRYDGKPMARGQVSATVAPALLAASPTRIRRPFADFYVNCLTTFVRDLHSQNILSTILVAVPGMLAGSLLVLAASRSSAFFAAGAAAAAAAGQQPLLAS